MIEVKNWCCFRVQYVYDYFHRNVSSVTKGYRNPPGFVELALEAKHYIPVKRVRLALDSMDYIAQTMRHLHRMGVYDYMGGGNEISTALTNDEIKIVSKWPHVNEIKYPAHPITLLTSIELLKTRIASLIVASNPKNKKIAELIESIAAITEQVNGLYATITDDSYPQKEYLDYGSIYVGTDRIGREIDNLVLEIQNLVRKQDK